MAATSAGAGRALPALVSALAAMLPAPVGAEDRAAAAFGVYHDDNRVTVLSPAASASREMGRLNADVHAGLDIISAASVDLVTAASPGGFHETRVELSGNGAWDLRQGRSLGLGLGTSIEPDFVTTSGSASARTDLLDRRMTLSADYGFAWSQIGRTGDTVFQRHRHTHRLDLGLSYALSPRTVAEVAWGAALSQGFHANPYRMVGVFGPGVATPLTAVPEALPDERLRQVVTARLRGRPAHRLFALVDYRFHGDDWQVRSHTGTARAVAALIEDHLDLTAEARGYLQSKASFYEARYASFPLVPDIRTADKELGRMRSLRGGLALDYHRPVRKGETLRVGVGVDLLRLWYLDYPPLGRRDAVIVTSSVEWEP